MTLGNRMRSRASTLALATTIIVVCPFAASRALAADGVHLEQVLDDWATALGGRAALTGIHTRHGVWDVTAFGLEGTWEEWSTAAAEHRLDVDLGGVFQMTVVRTPEKCWSSEQSQSAVECAGKDLEDEIRDAYLSTWSHLLPGRMPGTVELLPAARKGRELRVRVLPEGGTEVTFTIDPVTHLPTSYSSPGEEGETETTTLADWRRVDGILVPGTMTRSSGAPENDIVLTLEEMRVNEPPPSNAFSRPEARTRDVHFTRGQAADVPLDIQGVQLLLPVRVDDSPPLTFLFDTGASMTVLDAATARELGLEETGQAAGSGTGESRVDVQFARGVTLRIPGVDVRDHSVALIALRDDLESAFGREIDGILGYDVISQFVATIDYIEETLSLHERSDWDYEGTGAELPMRIVSTRTVCDAVLGFPDGSSQAAELYIDTGSSVAVRVHKPFGDAHDLLSRMPRLVRSSGGGIGGRNDNLLGRIASVKLGDLKFEGPICSFSQSESGIGADATFAGKVGGGILERCRVTLDYGRNRVFLEPNATFGSPFVGDVTGLSVRSGGRGDWHTFTVSEVIEGSPGDDAGVKTGDRILAVAGRPASELDMEELERMLGEGEPQLRLELERAGALVRVTLRKRPLL